MKMKMTWKRNENYMKMKWKWNQHEMKIEWNEINVCVYICMNECMSKSKYHSYSINLKEGYIGIISFTNRDPSEVSIWSLSKGGFLSYGDPQVARLVSRLPSGKLI